MAGNIKGITVEIGGDTVGLQSALKDVNKKSKDLQSELRSVERLLKFDPGNAELLAQKQQILAEQVLNTSEKLDRLKQAQAQVEAQFQRGDIGADQYRAFQREIVATEGQLRGLRQRLSQVGDNSSINEVRRDMQQLSDDTEEAQGSVKELGGELAGLVGGLAAGGGIAGVLEKSLDTSSLNTQIDISFDIPEESKSSVRDAIKAVEAYGIDAETALAAVQRQWKLTGSLTDQENTRLIKQAGTIVKAYSEIDLTELIQEANEMAVGMEMTHDEALAMTKALLDIGFPADQLDIITEYGQALTRAGYDAEEIQAILATGVEMGSWDLSVLLDGLKEGRILVSEFGSGVDDSMKDILKGTDISAKQLQQWGASVAAGGEQGKLAMQDLTTALMGVEDASKRNELGVKLFGSLWEENGDIVGYTLLDAQQKTADLQANQEALNESVTRLDSDPATQLNQALSDMQAELTPLLTTIAEVVTKIAEWIQENPNLAATITAITTALGIMIGIGMALSPIFIALAQGATLLQIGMLPLTGIVLGIMAAIAALIAIGVLLYKNWDVVKDKAKELKEGMIGAFSGIRDKASSIWGGIWGIIKGFINKVIDGTNSMIGGLNKLSFDAPDWVPVIGGKSFGISIPKIPKLATGGVVSNPTLAMVGDAGPGNPEIVAPYKMLKEIMSEVLNDMQTKGDILIEVPVILGERELARGIYRYVNEMNAADERDRLRARGYNG